MNAFEIIDHTKKYFPLIRKNNVEFDDYVNNILEEYRRIVNNSTDLFDCKECEKSEYAKLGRDKFIKAFNLFIDSVTESINLYLKGWPSLAFEKLNNAIRIFYISKFKSKIDRNY